MSKIVLFEGIDGSGKTSLIKKLKEKLEAEEHSTSIICGPLNKENVENNIKIHDESFVGTPARDKIKKINEILSFSLDRIDQLGAIKQKEGEGSEFILVDRSFISALAYQFSEQEDDLNNVNRIINLSLLEGFDIKFDLLILIDTSPSVAAGRIKNRDGRPGDGCGIYGEVPLKKDKNNALESSLESISINYKRIISELMTSYPGYFGKYSLINGDSDLELVLRSAYEAVLRR